MSIEVTALLQERSVLLLGMGLGLCASLCFNLGLALQKRAALDLPRLRSASIGALRGFLTSRGWLGAGALISSGWLLQFAALSFAPIGLVMPAVAAGVAFQALLAQRWFGERLTPPDLAGVAACSAGVVLMALSLDPRGELTGLDIDWARTLITAGSLAFLALVLAGVARGSGSWSGTGLGAAAGLLFAATGILTKALGIGALHEQSVPVSAATLALMLLLGGLALTLLQAAHQRGRAIVVIPLMGMLADFIPASMGALLFAEPWPAGWPRAVRLFAFAAIAVGILLLARPIARAHEGGVRAGAFAVGADT